MKYIEEEVEDLQVRSEEVRDILTSPHRWIIRAGSGYLLLLILVAFLISAFIKYPQLIRATAMVTSEKPVANIISQKPGYLTLWVTDRQRIEEGEYLGYLKNESNVMDVLQLWSDLDSLGSLAEDSPEFVLTYQPKDNIKLGELQVGYASFVESLLELRLNNTMSRFAEQTKALKQLVLQKQILLKKRQHQRSIFLLEIDLAEKRYAIDSLLWVDRVISNLDLEEKKINLLQKKHQLIDLESNIVLAETEIIDHSNEIEQIKLEEQIVRKRNTLKVNIAIDILKDQLRTWELNYLIKSPLSGEVALYNYWADFQFVNVNEELMAILPPEEEYYARVKAPIFDSGKIKIGQEVNIKLDAFPYVEFGILKGRVKSISQLQREGFYIIDLELVNGLTTTFDRKIPFKPELAGLAEIVTEDLSLLSRFFYHLRKINYNNL